MLRITEQASLKHLNTFGVAAVAGRLIELYDEAELFTALDACGERGPDLVLGGGSNLLLTRSIDGSVLRLATQGSRLLRQAGPEVIVESAAGAPWHKFVMWTLSNGWGGLENLALIPGTVGASPIQNIGAYGVELQSCFAGLTAVNLRNRSLREFAPLECGLGYRDSIFKRPDLGDWLILRVRFRLIAGAPAQLSYAEVRNELHASDLSTVSTSDVAQAVIRIRTRKLPDPAELGNAGSFFKNPLVAAEFAQSLRKLHPDMPLFAVASSSARIAELPDGQHGNVKVSEPRSKLSAAWLIEQCGWKGYRQGDAGVYAKHSLVLVNHGQASGNALWELAQAIQQSVAQRFGVQLEVEPRVI